MSKIEIHRRTMRGLRKCPRPGCRQYNGNRAKGCCNERCPFYSKKKSVRTKNCIDPIQLISHNETKIYSVRIKDRDPLQRNFVQITDVTLSSDEEGAIVSRNAICFVDTCKYDSNDINISCKHVKCASECNKMASEITINKDVLYKMNISVNLKDSLWQLYAENEGIVPPIQKINKSTFVIKCTRNGTFPSGSGRLHINAIPDDDDCKFSYSCSCKRLKIFLSPNNSVVLENDNCDHLVFLLAGILSSETLQRQYRKFVNALNILWMAENLIFDNSLLPTEGFFSFSENILGSCVEFNSNILENDPNMRRQDTAEEEDEIKLISVPLAGDDSNCQFESANLELAECQIELMDQFKLTNQIDLCNDEIQLCEADLFNENNIICGLNTTPNEILETVYTQPPKKINCTILKQPKRQEKKFRKSVNIIPPILEFNSWFGFVIEKINLSLDINSCETVITHSFNIKHDFFTFLNEKFSLGEKKRIPNSTNLIKKGKLKGLTKSTWIFTTISTVKRIFSNNDITIEFEKSFMEKSPGLFLPYVVSNISDESNVNKKLKKLLPTMYKVFIELGCRNKTSSGFKVEWIPNVYPKSEFGILRIEFCIGFKRNNKILEKINSTVN